MGQEGAKKWPDDRFYKSKVQSYVPTSGSGWLQSLSGANLPWDSCVDDASVNAFAIREAFIY